MGTWLPYWKEVLIGIEVLVEKKQHPMRSAYWKDATKSNHS